MEMDLKRKKRLEKNREIAKNCRKRKKEKKEALEEEIARLQEENSRMRVQLQDETNDAEREAQREAGLKRLRECYEAHDEEGIARESQRYYAEWEEFGRKRDDGGVPSGAAEAAGVADAGEWRDDCCD